MELNIDLEKYILGHSEEEDPVLYELNRETHLKAIQPRMISGHLQGLLLSMFSKMIAPEKILEIGTFTGYSAICLAKGLPKNGKLVTIEIDDELESLAARYFEKAGIRQQVEQLIGDANQLIPGIPDLFDLVFIDADKREYEGYYNLVFEKVKPGGYIIADNTLWSGKVVDKECTDEPYTQSILQFNKMIKNDRRVEKVILPIRDGLTIIRKL